ncbi:MAG TPA: aldolase catalytic domain-containing protein [Pseudobacteroides sp.]|nr:aldolase catalytic domain-containing protein [Pseudobacteroides sp.]
MSEVRVRTEVKKGTWLTYRPDIKVLDCTIRDGGLVNNFNFEDKFVKAVYNACVEAGVDYMEMGYKASKKIFARDGFGAWKFCDEDDIRKIIGDNETDLKISVMADAERTDYHVDILPKSQSVIDMVRVATYVHQIPTAVDMIKDAHDKGYETTINIMAVSQVKESDLEEALEILSKTEVDVIYVVDSFGSMYSEDIQELTAKYLCYAEATGKKVGIHAHNNQQLAYANTIESIIRGTSYVDATIAGLGRGAGNCPMELILGFLKNPKFHLRPILECIQNSFPEIKNSCQWGFDIPYMLTGQLNQHPRAAISFLSSNRSDYTNFYDSIVNGD